MFVVKRLLECLLLPPVAPLILILVGLCWSRWQPTRGRRLAWCGVALTLFFTTPFTVNLLLLPLERSAAPLQAEQAREAQAIVILGGGGKPYAAEYGGPTPTRTTLERLRYGAKLARETGLPILVSGGVAGVNYPEAWMMAESLKQDFGIPPLWLEDRSENTEQNARYTAAMLKQAGIERIVLVTHAAHMRRALAYFKASGLQVVPAPTAFFTPMADADNMLSWLPSANAAYAGWYVMHEAAGLLHQQFSELR